MSKESDKSLLAKLREEHFDDEVKGPKLVLGYLGIFLILIGFLVLLPLLMLAFYPKEGEKFYAFLIPGLIALAIGVTLTAIFFKKHQGRLTLLEDIVLILSVWILAIVFSAIPYYFYGYNFSQGMFEATSGYTSTGLTIMNWDKEIVKIEGIEHLQNHMVFFHRAMTQLVGGVGLVLIVSSAISEKSGLNLYTLEGHNDKLLPNLVKSARVIFTIYMCYIAMGTLLYVAVGVDPFDAFCNSIAAVSTGGFSTKTGGIYTIVQELSMNGSSWRGILVEVITEVLMVLGGTNFVIHFNLFTGKIKKTRHFEYVVFIACFLIFYPIVIAGTTKYMGGDIAKGFRFGTFEYISGITTTGFGSLDSYHGHTIDGVSIQFPSYLLATLIIMMNIGMQSGSTCGGIKDHRIALIFKDLYYKIKKTLYPSERVEVPMVYRFGNKVKVEKDETIEAYSYASAYILLVLIGTMIISIICTTVGLNAPDHPTIPYTYMECMFEFSSAISSYGLGFGITNAMTISPILWTLMTGMLLGRLEIFIFFTFIGKTISNIRSRKHSYKN